MEDKIMAGHKEHSYIDGKYYFGKGYFWKGKFIRTNYGQDAYELGYYHGKSIAKKLPKRKLEKMIQTTAMNDYEQGKIDAIKNYLSENPNANANLVLVRFCRPDGTMYWAEYHTLEVANGKAFFQGRWYELKKCGDKLCIDVV